MDFIYFHTFAVAAAVREHRRPEKKNRMRIRKVADKKDRQKKKKNISLYRRRPRWRWERRRCWRLQQSKVHPKFMRYCGAVVTEWSKRFTLADRIFYCLTLFFINRWNDCCGLLCVQRSRCQLTDKLCGVICSCERIKFEHRHWKVRHLFYDDFLFVGLLMDVGTFIQHVYRYLLLSHSLYASVMSIRRL